MNFSFGVKSLILFALSVVFLVLLTLFESSLISISTAAERVVSFLLLVLPGLIGIIMAVKGILRKESKAWIAWLGVLLNFLFALFYLFVLSFAG